MKILVLDGNENQAVACVRSLARAGHCVYVGASSSWSKAAWSRSCRGRFVYPAPELDGEAFVARLASEVERHPEALVLPMTERTTLPLSEHRDEILRRGGRLVLPPHETILRAFDKLETTRLAKSLQIETPQTLLLDDEVSADALRSLRFPVVLKPRCSEEIYAGRTRATGAPCYASNEEEFRRALSEMRRRCRSMVVQEFVEGTGSGYFVLMKDGEPLLEFAHRRIRDVRPTGSGSAVRESVSPDPKVRGASLAILRSLDWLGVAMVEFRIRPDGTAVFLEVNGRFWNSLALAIYAGADFPARLAELAEHGKSSVGNSYPNGIRCRWLLGDFRHLIEVLKGPPSGFPGTYPSRWSTLLSFLAPVPNTYHDNFQLADPLPELGDWLNFLRKLGDRFRRRTRSS